MKKALLLLMAATAVALALTGCVTDDASIWPDDPADATPMVKPQIKLEKHEYVLGIGDEIDVSVFKQQELNVHEKINSSGIVMFPMIGDVEVKGKGVLTLRDELTEKYSKYYVKPQVMIRIAQTSNQKFMVVGEVKQAGLFILDSNYSVSEAVAKAGGVGTDGQKNNVLLIRRGKKGNEVFKVDLDSNYTKLDYSNDYSIASGDIVYVPPKRIAITARFMTYIGQIVGPIVAIESGIVLWPQVGDALSGDSSGQNNIVVGQ